VTRLDSQSFALRNLFFWGAAFFSLLVALIISDVSVIDAFLTLCVVSVQTFGGILIFRWCVRAEMSPSPEFIGMGFAIGSFLAMIGDQFTIKTPIRDIGWLLPVFLGILAQLSGPKSQSFIKSEVRSATTLPWAIAGSFLALGLEWYWSMPIGIAMVAVLFYLDFSIKSFRSMNKFVLIFLTILLGCVMALMLSLRPEIWWIEHFYDFLLYENWSNALSSFGRVGIGGVGYEFNYHWFSYAWNGLISRLSSADPWVATTRSSILISVVVIQLLLSAIIKQYGVKNHIANLSATIVSMFSTVTLWRGDSMRLLHLESFSGVFALVWLLAVFLLVLKARESISVRQAIVIVVLCIATFGAKTAFGGVAVILIFALFVEAVINRRKDFKNYLFLFSISMGLVLLLAKYLFLDSRLPKIWSPGLGFIEFLGAMESENLIFRKHETAFLALWWIAAALLVQIFAALVFAVNSFFATRKLLVVEVIAACSCVGLLCVVTFWDGNQNYFAYAAFVVLLPLVASFFGNDLTRELLFASKISRLKLRAGFVFLLIVAVSILTLRMPEIGVATQSEVFLRHTPYLASSAISLVVILLFINQFRSIPKFASRLFPPLLIVILSITSVTFYFSEWSHEVDRVFKRWEREGPGKVDTLFGSQDIQEVIRWINSNTERDSIIVIDYDTPTCPIDPWGFQESQCAQAAHEIRTQPHMGREVLEGAIRRQMLIRNLHPLAFGNDLPLEARFNDIETKRVAIRNFSLNGDLQSLKSLQESGVSWMVINLEQANGANSWSDAEIEFRNDSFVILKLPRLGAQK
jgi:hypothetical protein